MLDISILNADKVKNKAELLDSNVTVFGKTDGTKLTLIRSKTEWSKNYWDNWVVAYKGNVMYSEEFKSLSTEKVKKSSIGVAQYKVVFDHLEKINNNIKSIKPNTEFMVEFLQNKPTTTRDYKQKHGMVLIGYSSTSYSVTNGKLKSKSPQLKMANREKYAKVLKLDTPLLIYKGKLRNYGTKQGTDEDQYEFIKQKFLGVESAYGEKEEGVVITTNKGKSFKFLQADQHDKTIRFERKMKYRMDQDDENQYWVNIRTYLKPILAKVKGGTLQHQLSELSDIVYNNGELPNHSKKDLLQRQEDAYLTGKSIIIRGLKGNRNALFSGRFSPPTAAHMKIISDAMKKHDGVVLNIVKAAKNDPASNPFPLDIQMKMWKTVFPKLHIQTSTTGNLFTMINKSEYNINTVLAGTDRVKS